MTMSTTQIQPGVWAVHVNECKLGIILEEREGFFSMGNTYFIAKTTNTVMGHGRQVFGRKHKTFKEAEDFLFNLLKNIASTILEEK